MTQRPTREDFRRFIQLANEIANMPTEGERIEARRRIEKRELIFEVLRGFAWIIASGGFLAAMLASLFGG